MTRNATARAPLERDLRHRISGEVRFDAGSRALYSTDASNYRRLPVGVVIPRTIDDVLATVEVCRAHGAPLLSRGGGTSLAGQTANEAVVIDWSKYLHDAVAIDRSRRLARVRPGIILDHLRERTSAGDQPLTFAPDPATHTHCTLGGMIGNNSCGVHSVQAEFEGPGPRTSDNVHTLEVLTYDGVRMRVGPTSEDELATLASEPGRRGDIYRRLRRLRDRYADLIRQRFPRIPRRVSGYNLDELLPERGFNVARALVGTEGTCATVLESELHLLPSPAARAILLAGFVDVEAAAAVVPAVREHRPMGLEGFDDVLVRSNEAIGINADGIRLLPEGRGWLLVEFGGADPHEAEDRARTLSEALRRSDGATEVQVFEDAEECAEVWELRESGLGATAFQPGKPDHWPGWEDSAVAPERLSEYLRDLRRLVDRFGYDAALYGHFGQGCVHSRISFDLASPKGVRTWRAFLEEAASLVAGYGGSISGEHGDGQARAELLETMYGPELVQAFREFKGIWDPDGRMNPGKVVDPAPMDADLRIQASREPRDGRMHFSYPEDGGSFAHAALRCVGVGECRRTEGGTMCPSFMVTHEEKHTTRGRARMLFEMLGNPELRSWRSTEVREALDLCLSCKGCKGDCPVSVDMATYKAEFLAHHYRRRLRPRTAYSLGLIYWWARAASRAPRLANAVIHAPGLSRLLKRIAGVAPERQAPRFARRTFRRAFHRRPRGGKDAPPVLFWPDTFTNHFQPEVARAGVEVLERAGYRVIIPDRILCCGRPLYDHGMLKLAKRQLRQVLGALRPHLDAGTPVVGVEPSCVAVFRDELPNLFPEDPAATRLPERTFLLSEFLQRHASRWEPPRVEGTALVQIHCHHGAVLDADAEEAVLDRLGLEYEILDSGCCGMAGSFGFEAGEKYDVGRLAGERVLLPRVRDAGPDTMMLADGFSCRLQIQQGTGRRALHLAQILAEGSRPDAGMG